MVYLFIIILLLILSVCYDINGIEKYKNQCYMAMLIIFILLAGLRWRVGLDTPNYLYDFYHTYPTLGKFSFVDYPIGRDPFYVLLNSFVKSLGGRFYVVQILHATFVNILIFSYIKKHSRYIFTCLFFYFIVSYESFNAEIMRGSMSIVICLFANDYLLDKKWIKGYSLLFLALMFHFQTIMLFVLPILFFLRFNIIGGLVLIGAFFLGHFIQVNFGDYIALLQISDAVDDKTSRYAESEMYGDQMRNFNFVIVLLVQFFIYVILALKIVKYEGNTHLLRFEPFLMIAMIFVLIRINLEIAYRFVEYYSIYMCFFFAESFVVIAKKVGALSLSLSYLRAFFIFFPFFFITIYFYIKDDGRRKPYVSIIDRSIVKEREAFYSENDRPHANANEY